MGFILFNLDVKGSRPAGEVSFEVIDFGNNLVNSKYNFPYWFVVKLI